MIAICCGVIVLAVFLAIANTKSAVPTMPTKAFYSDDDGSTYFVDDITKLYPFDHDGRQAYRAYVFRSDSGKPFIGYIERITDNAMQRLNELKSQPSTPEIITQIGDVEAAGREIKKPGDSKWYRINSNGYIAIIQGVTAPDGSKQVFGVSP